MPEKCDRKGASPTESAAIQDWAKGTLWSWYAEMTSRHIRRTRYVHREGIPSAFKKGAEDLNAGGTAGNRHDSVPSRNATVHSEGGTFLLRALSASLLGAYVRYMQSTWRGLVEPSTEHCYEHLARNL